MAAAGDSRLHRSRKTLLRPLNFGENQPGEGFGRFETPGGIAVGVINLRAEFLWIRRTIRSRRRIALFQPSPM